MPSAVIVFLRDPERFCAIFPLSVRNSHYRDYSTGRDLYIFRLSVILYYSSRLGLSARILIAILERDDGRVKMENCSCVLSPGSSCKYLCGILIVSRARRLQPGEELFGHHCRIIDICNSTEICDKSEMWLWIIFFELTYQTWFFSLFVVYIREIRAWTGSIEWYTFSRTTSYFLEKLQK